jgi:hypothetical protein
MRLWYMVKGDEVFRSIDIGGWRGMNKQGDMI